MLDRQDKRSVVVIGGGTGTYNILQGLKRFWKEIEITKIVSMADSGGSNARIRDEFGLLPLSDVNRSLAALSSDVQFDGQLLRELFLYRFTKGNGISGHNFGNLLLVALTDMLGSEARAIKAASHILHLRGEVLPVTEDNIHLVATYSDGTVVTGEHDIDEPPEARVNCRIVNLSTDKPARVTAEVEQVLQSADMIILGPGDLYTSLLANCVIEGMPEAIVSSKAQFVYIANLMSRPGQTRGLTMSGYLDEIAKYVNRKPDTVFINIAPLPDEVLEKYAQEGDRPVIDDLGSDIAVVRSDFIATEMIKKKAGDVLKRSFIRHDGHKLAAAIMKML